MSAGAANKPSHRAYLGLGSNVAAEKNIPLAIKKLQKRLKIEALSQVWETPPVGSDGPCFLNAAARISTSLDAERLKLEVLLIIEEELGRVRTEDKNAPREIDLDILIYDDEVFDEEIWSQAHIAVPLAEVYLPAADSQIGASLLENAEQLRKSAQIQKRPDFLGKHEA